MRGFLLRALAILIASITTLAGGLYAVFAVAWLHAPVPEVALVTLVLCAVPAAVSWGLLRAAKRIQSSEPTKT
jgi:hypothetical protein